MKLNKYALQKVDVHFGEHIYLVESFFCFSRITQDQLNCDNVSAIHQ